MNAARTNVIAKICCLSAAFAVAESERPAWNDIEVIRENTEKPRDPVSLDTDYGQMGVGGDDSWGKRTLQKYSLNEKRYRHRFTLQPYTPDADRLDRLVRR